MSEWKQVGPTWQRLYACGTMGLVSKASGGRRFARYAIEANDCVSNLGCHDSQEEAAAELDKKFDPQPAEHRFETLTVFVLGGRENVVLKSKYSEGWFARSHASDHSKSREAAERDAIDWLKQK